MLLQIPTSLQWRPLPCRKLPPQTCLELQAERGPGAGLVGDRVEPVDLGGAEAKK